MAYGSDPQAIYQRKTSLLAGVDIEGLNGGTLPWNARVGKFPETGIRKLHIFNKKMSQNDIWHWNARNNPDLITLGEAFLLISGKAHPVWIHRDAAIGLLEQGGGAPLWLGSPTVEDAMKQTAQSMSRRNPGGEVDIVQKQSHGWIDKKRNFNAYEAARERFLEQDFTQLHLSVGSPIVLLVDIGWLGYIDNQMREPFEKEMLAGRETPPALVLNPRLANLNMAQAMDPATVFQEVSQFISGVAPGQQMPMVEISDNDKIHKRGFDPKYGFRTRPKTMK